MQNARAFGGRRQRAAAQPDPDRQWEYFQHQNQQQQRRILAQVPKGSRVFQPRRDLEQTVLRREEEQRRRAEVEMLATQSRAKRLTRSFGQGQARTQANAALPTVPAVPDSPPGRPFGSTRLRQQEEAEEAYGTLLG